VIMVSYRTGPVLFEAVETALAAPDIAELVVVNHDNPPEDEARLVALAAAEARMTLINTRANLGFAKGCNIGAATAAGDHLFFLNPDAVPGRGAAAALARALEGLPEPAIAGACIIGEDGREQAGARRGALTIRTAVNGYLGGPGLRRDHEPMPERAAPVETVSGAAMMMRRAGFDQLGGFDEGYFLHVEDIDICKRARDAGGAVVFEPRAVVRHAGSSSTVSKLKVERWKANGLLRYFARHGGAPGPVKAAMLAPVIYAAVYGRALVRALRG
ncbi:MAG: glycosyltransferase family 2 protein, partial [Oceanicaulis sp.]